MKPTSAPPRASDLTLLLSVIFLDQFEAGEQQVTVFRQALEEQLANFVDEAWRTSSEFPPRR